MQSLSTILKFTAELKGMIFVRHNNICSPLKRLVIFDYITMHLQTGKYLGKQWCGKSEPISFMYISVDTNVDIIYSFIQSLVGSRGVRLGFKIILFTHSVQYIRLE